MANVTPRRIAVQSMNANTDAKNGPLHDAPSKVVIHAFGHRAGGPFMHALVRRIFQNRANPGIGISQTPRKLKPITNITAAIPMRITLNSVLVAVFEIDSQQTCPDRQRRQLIHKDRHNAQ